MKKSIIMLFVVVYVTIVALLGGCGGTKAEKKDSSTNLQENITNTETGNDDSAMSHENSSNNSIIKQEKCVISAETALQDILTLYCPELAVLSLGDSRDRYKGEVFPTNLGAKANYGLLTAGNYAYKEGVNNIWLYGENTYAIKLELNDEAASYMLEQLTLAFGAAAIAFDGSNNWVKDDIIYIHYSDSMGYSLAIVSKFEAAGFFPDSYAIICEGEPIFSSMYGYENLYYAKDPITGLTGIYNSSDNTYPVDMIYDCIYGLSYDFSDFSQIPSAMWAKKDGYYGVIDLNGNIVVDFYYSEIEDPYFSNTPDINGNPVYITIIKEGNAYGVINDKGEMIVPSKYNHELSYQVGFFSAVYYVDEYPYDKYYTSVYDVYGKEIVSNQKWTYGARYREPYIYVLQHESNGRSKVYDFEGNCVSDIKLGKGVKVYLPKNGIGTAIFSSASMKCIDKELNIISDVVFCEEVFSTSNYIVGNAYGHGYPGYVMVDRKGNVVEIFKYKSNHSWRYGYEHFVIGYHNTSEKMDMLYVRATGETIEYAEVKYREFDNGTETVTVKNSDNGLYGLWVNGTLLYDTVYTDISYQDGVFTLTRGAVTSTYTP